MTKLEIFLGPALAPFFVLLILLATRPLVNLLRRRLPDGRLKRLLFWRY